MSRDLDRLDLRPLLAGLKVGLRLRRREGVEPPDTPTILVLVATPLVVGGLIAGFQVTLQAADQLLAGAALLVGALFAAFGMVASWRERLLERDRKVDGIKLRALNEATAHILFSVVVSLIATGVLAVLSNLVASISAAVPAPAPTTATAAPGTTPPLPGTPPVPLTEHIAAVALSAIGCAALAYLLVSMLIVVNLLWDAYSTAGQSGTGTLHVVDPLSDADIQDRC